MFIAEKLAITPLHSVAIAWKKCDNCKTYRPHGRLSKKENKHDASLIDGWSEQQSFRLIPAFLLQIICLAILFGLVV